MVMGENRWTGMRHLLSKGVQRAWGVWGESSKGDGGCQTGGEAMVSSLLFCGGQLFRITDIVGSPSDIVLGGLYWITQTEAKTLLVKVT